MKATVMGSGLVIAVVQTVLCPSLEMGTITACVSFESGEKRGCVCVPVFAHVFTCMHTPTI